VLAHLQLHQVHQAYITSSQLLHSPEVVQAQLAIPLLHLQQCLEGAIRRLHMESTNNRSRMSFFSPSLNNHAP
jgi:hypothetical protein